MANGLSQINQPGFSLWLIISRPKLSRLMQSHWVFTLSYFAIPGNGLKCSVRFELTFIQRIQFLLAEFVFTNCVHYDCKGWYKTNKFCVNRKLQRNWKSFIKNVNIIAAAFSMHRKSKTLNHLNFGYQEKIEYMKGKNHLSLFPIKTHFD